MLQLLIWNVHSIQKKNKINPKMSKYGKFPLIAEAKAIRCLKRLNTNKNKLIVSLANNHILDAGPQYVNFMVRTIKKMTSPNGKSKPKVIGICNGCNRLKNNTSKKLKNNTSKKLSCEDLEINDNLSYKIITVKGVRIAILGLSEWFPRFVNENMYKDRIKYKSDKVPCIFYGPGKDNYKMDLLRKIIQRLKNKVRTIIAYVHFRKEYDYLTPKVNLNIAEILTSYGIDLVVGSGPHVIHKLTIINNKPCFMSLGNFVFDSHVNNNIVGNRIKKQIKTLKSQGKYKDSIKKRTHTSKILHLNMNIIDDKIKWQYRYLDCSINNIGVPSIKKENEWRETENYKLASDKITKKLNRFFE